MLTWFKFSFDQTKMSYSDFLKRMKINSPAVIDTRMQLPDASSYIWRKRLGASIGTDNSKHSISNVFDPSLAPVHTQKQTQSFVGTGFGGKVPDASIYTMSLGARAIGQDNFGRGKIQTVPKNSSGNCLTTTPASQVVNQQGNAEGSNAGLNMGHVTTCTAPYNPQSKSRFVEVIPDIRLHKIGYGVNPTITNLGVDYAQNPIVCANTSGAATNPDGTLLAKDIVPLNLHSERPVFVDKLTAISGPQGGDYNAGRPSKVGGALRRIPQVNKSHGFAGYSKYVPIPYVPPNNAIKHLKINDPNHTAR